MARARRIDLAKLDDAVALYLTGKSLPQCYAIAGISPKTVAKELRRRGIPVRTGSEAQYLAASQRTPEKRREMMAPAYTARRGSRNSTESLIRRAAARERNLAKPMSVHEAEFARLLDLRQVSYRREVAVGPYNVDFAVGPVAVEILGGNWHMGHSQIDHPRRSEHILDAGWVLCYIWRLTKPYVPLTPQAVEYVVALANQASSDPSVLGEYRVIRGDAKFVSAGRDKLDYLTYVLPAHDGLES